MADETNVQDVDQDQEEGGEEGEINRTTFIEYVRGPQFPENPEAHQDELMGYGILHWTFSKAVQRVNDGTMTKDAWKPQQQGKGVGYRFFNTTDKRHYYWAGTEWKKMARQSDAPEIIANFWYLVLETKNLKEQILGTLFTQIPWTPGKFMDIVRGPALPTSHCYIGRVFYLTTEKKHYTFSEPDIGEERPSWKTKSEYPEAMSPSRYERIDAVQDNENLQIRVYCAAWMHPLIQRERLVEELAVAAPFMAPPPPRLARTGAQKKADAEAAKRAAEEAADVLPEASA